MEKQPPSLGRLLTMVVFALTCFGLLLYLWASFGGAVPLGSKGYRFTARFDEATQLADNADVRISGVTVGHVIDSTLDGDRTLTEIEIDSRYAPIPSDTRAILRAKTLLGETYVELTPGSRDAPALSDGGRLADGQVRPTVELDEILRAFDPRTRAELQRFVAGLAGTVDGRGRDLSDALGNAPAFAEQGDALLEVLESERDALSRVIRDTGTVFEAAGRRQGELAGLVAAGERVLSATARRNAELSEAVRILPTTLRELRPTLTEIEALARDAGPVVRELRPVAPLVPPALRSTVALAPELEAFFGDLDRVIAAGRTALPGTRRVVSVARRLVPVLEPLLRELLPVVEYAAPFRFEVIALGAGVGASAHAREAQRPGGEPLNYLRVVVPTPPESAVGHEERLGSNRPNPYMRPRALDRLAEGIEAFDCSHAQPDPQAPPCLEQSPYEFQGEAHAYPHVKRDP